MLLFENIGVMEMEFLRTFGASVKNTENPIGFFGTGLKYAIAVILRNKGSIKIFSGLDEYNFTLEKKILRDQPFEIVTMNSSSLGFTSELGKTWEPWMAYRELYCNLLDEKGSLMHSLAGFENGEENKTKIYVEGLDQIYYDRNKYFLDGTHDALSEGVEISNRPNQCQYYRNVRINCEPSVLTYNFIKEVALTEDRTIKYTSSLENIAGSIVRLKDKKLLKAALSAKEGTLEHKFNYKYFSGHTEEFYEVTKSLGSDANFSAQAVLAAKTSYSNVSCEELTQREQEIFNKAVRTIDSLNLGFTKDPNYLFVHCFPGDNNKLAEVVDNRVVISKEAFNSDFTATLLEELVHLNKGYYDCTRNLQTYLFQMVVKLAEENLIKLKGTI
jgi:hypothetical protein